MSRRRGGSSAAGESGGDGGNADGGNRRQGDVRGPTSALTSFLRDRGIRASNVRSGFSRGRVDGQETPPAGEAGPSGTAGALASVTEDLGESEPNTPAAFSSAPATPAADSTLDGSYFEEDEVSLVATSSAVRASSTKTASSSKQTLEITSSTTKISAKRKQTDVGDAKKKKKKKKDSDDEDEDFELQMVPKARYADRKPGSFAMCAECNKKFTITRYTNTHPDIPGGLLCGPCDKEIGPASGQKGIGKKAATEAPAVKKRARAVKGKNVLTSNKPSVMSLTKCCIEVIGKAIQDVEEFGDIGTVNKDRVCQIVCKNRDLTADTLKLFLDVENSSLSLYDCTRLEPEALRMLANYCPSLHTMKLFQCGFMDSETILHYATRLTKLRHLQLFAAFLVRKEAWIKFFEILREQGRPLDAYMVQQSPRIDNSVVASLVETCPNLTKLQLADCGALDDSSLLLLHPLKHLKHLDLTHGGLVGESFTDDGIIPLLESVGENLQTLILDNNILLTDRTLIEGVKVNCPNLIELSVVRLEKLLPTGIAELFSEDWVNKKGFVRFNFHRCTQLDDDALEAVIRHSGSSLLKLDLNSVDGLREKSLKFIAENCPMLTELDVSFVRDVDDFILKHFLDKLPAIKKISIYGNNRISDLCPTKLGVRVLGHEQGVVVGYD